MTTVSKPVRNPLFARYFNRFAARREERGNRELRQELLSGLSGRVIEVGAGNGLNFPHYPQAVREVVAVEPEPYLRVRAAETTPAAPVPVRVTDGTAGNLPAADGEFDAVVVSGLLCSVPDVEAALAEFRRVLRSGGQPFGAQALPPLVLHGQGGGTHGAQRGAAARGQADEFGPGIAGVGDPRQVAVQFQAGDDLGHGLAGDAQGLGQVRGVPPAAEEGDQQQGVQRAQATHVLRGELAAQPLRARSRKQLDKCRASPLSTAAEPCR